jgi:hypothetical protein
MNDDRQHRAKVLAAIAEEFPGGPGRDTWVDGQCRKIGSALRKADVNAALALEIETALVQPAFVNVMAAVSPDLIRCHGCGKAFARWSNLPQIDDGGTVMLRCGCGESEVGCSSIDGGKYITLRGCDLVHEGAPRTDSEQLVVPIGSHAAP